MRLSLRRFCLIATALLPLSAWAGTAIPFTINLSKPVNVVTSGGTPRIAVDVAGTTRYATYTSGSGTSALVFTYNMQAGDVDLDGVAVSSPVQLNGGTIKDLSGNPLTNLTFTPPNTSGIKVNYPSLGMDFTNGAGGRYTLNGTPYTTLASFLTAAGGSFTRASVGTYFDSAGVLQTASANTPRLDYDPVTHAAKGMLIEESRTNNAIYSEQFDNGGWTKASATTTANATAAPDGSVTADSVAATNTSSFTYQIKTVSSGATYTFSVFVKRHDSDYSVLFLTDSSANGIRKGFNLSTGAVGTTQVIGAGWTYVSSSITPLQNGWYRLSLTVTGNGTTLAGGLHPAVDADASITSTVGRYNYVWGAQLEQGAFATSYIPTTTAAVTRAADVLTVPVASIPSHNLTAGTWFSEFYKPIRTGNSIIVIYGPPVVPEPITDRGSSVGTWNGTTQLDLAGNPAIRKFASAYDSGGRYLSLNNAFTSGAGTFNLSTATTVGIGSWNGASAPNAAIKKIKYYPARVPNTQLQLMTQ